jgi:hypothetical protein
VLKFARFSKLKISARNWSASSCTPGACPRRSFYSENSGSWFSTGVHSHYQINFNPN